MMLKQKTMLNLGFLMTGLVLCFLYFKPVFGILDLPPHLGYEQMIRQVAQVHPGLQVSAQVSAQSDLELYARYVKTDEAMTTLRDDHAKHLYRWYVQVNQDSGQSIYEYTLDGRPLGFSHEVKDNVYFPPVSEQDAQSMIYDHIKKEGLNIDQWEIKSYEKKQVEKRQDHYFRLQKKDPLFAMAYEQISLVVSGDHITGFLRQVHVPDDFMIKMNEVRQSNQVLTYIGMIGMFALALAGAFMGLYALRREGFDWSVSWRGAVLCGLSLGVIAINNAELSIQNMAYYFSTQLKWALVIKHALTVFGSVTVGYILPILAAVSLIKKVYPDRVHLLSWLKIEGYKNPFNRQIVYIAYGATLAFCLYEMAYYWVTNQYLGFFLPPSYAVDLNASISWVEGINPILQAFNPGFTEEVIFRLIPIGLLLAYRKRQGGMAWNIVMIAQALIFAMAHANYPADPFYARVLELIIPAIFLAYLAIYVDVMAAILTHILYDAVWFGIGYYSFDFSWAQGIYFLTILMPLFICFYGAGQNQKPVMLNYNQPVQFFDYGLIMSQQPSNRSKASYLWLLVGVILLMVLMFIQPPSMLQITKPSEARAVAGEHWKVAGYMPDDWYFALSPSSVDVDDWYYVQQNFPEQWPKLMPLFLPAGCWDVKAASLDPKWKDYGFNLRVCNHTVLAQNIILPYEAAKQNAASAPASIDEKLRQLLGASSWRVISDTLEQYPNRSVIGKTVAVNEYQGIKAPSDDTLRVFVKMDGDEITAFSAGIHISQEEARNFLSNQAWLSVFKWREVMILGALLVFLGLMVRFSGITRPYHKSIYVLILSMLWLMVWADREQAIVSMLQQGSGSLVGYMMLLFSAVLMMLVAFVIKEIFYAFREVMALQSAVNDAGFSVGLGVLYGIVIYSISQLQPWVPYQWLLGHTFGMMHSPWLMWPATVLYFVGGIGFAILATHMVFQLFRHYFTSICLLLGLVLYTSQITWVALSAAAVFEFAWYMIGAALFAWLVRQGLVYAVGYLLGVTFVSMCFNGIAILAIVCGLAIVFLQYWNHLRDSGIRT
jgi:hypothetical protein